MAPRSSPNSFWRGPPSVVTCGRHPSRERDSFGELEWLHFAIAVRRPPDPRVQKDRVCRRRSKNRTSFAGRTRTASIGQRANVWGTPSSQKKKSTPGRIRTCNPRFRRPMRYPIVPRVRLGVWTFALPPTRSAILTLYSGHSSTLPGEDFSDLRCVRLGCLLHPICLRHFMWPNHFSKGVWICHRSLHARNPPSRPIEKKLRRLAADSAPARLRRDKPRRGRCKPKRVVNIRDRSQQKPPCPADLDLDRMSLGKLAIAPNQLCHDSVLDHFDLLHPIDAGQ